MEDAVRIFRLVATEFDVLNDETVEAWLNLTSPLISKKVFGKLYDQAIALLTAHRLKMAGYGNRKLLRGRNVHRLQRKSGNLPDG